MKKCKAAWSLQASCQWSAGDKFPPENTCNAPKGHECSYQIRGILKRKEVIV